MNFKEYQAGARTTAIYPDKGKVGGLSYATMGLTGEAGEIANKVKKILRDDNGTLTDVRKLELIGELGDVLWYCAALADELGVELEDVAQGNLEKLAVRKAMSAIKGSGDSREKVAYVQSKLEYGNNWD